MIIQALHTSATALDHTVRSFNVATTVGQTTTLDLDLVRFGAIVAGKPARNPIGVHETKSP